MFNLTEAKPFYFLSGGGYCFHGMKLAVNVVEFVPSPEPAPAKNGSPADIGTHITLVVLLALAVFYVLPLEPN